MTTPVAEQLAQLSATAGRQLRTEWRRQFGADPPPDLPRDLLLRALAHRTQERAGGDLGAVARRQLRALVASLGPPGTGRPIAAPPALLPGTRLVRTWGGSVHSVTVREDGFEYRDRRYRSLSEIARLISGAHWSGPRFFGLTRSSTARSGQGATASPSPEQVAGDAPA